MSTQVFPALAGLGWSVGRADIWQSRRPTAISGKEVRIADWSYPRRQWTLTFDFLRQGAFQGSTFVEFSDLEGFFNLRSGGFDSFLYQDPNDNSITGQELGTTDGVSTVYPLVRAFGGYAEPILAPNLTATFNLYLNSVLQSASTYTVTPWGTANSNGPGQVIFNSAPSSGETITADFSWYFPVRFDQDNLGFEQFMQSLFQLKKVSFTSIK